jgi:Leucine-rich repeat (LRR) protein
MKKLEITDENAQRLGELEEYPNLESLSISCLEDLQALPDSIGHLKKLKELKIDNGNGCAMNPLLPEAIGNLGSLETLVLYGGQDPRGPGPQPGQRNRFPRSMSQLKRLTHLNLGRNGLEKIPTFVKDLPQLEELNFDFNDLNDLPEFLNNFPNLTLSLGNNCDITGNEAKKEELQRRFPKIKFNFDNEYECHAQSN